MLNGGEVVGVVEKHLEPGGLQLVQGLGGGAGELGDVVGGRLIAQAETGRKAEGLCTIARP